MFRVSLVGGSKFQKFENIPSILVDGYNFIASIKWPGIIHFYNHDRMAVHSNYDSRAAHAGREDCPDNVFIVEEIDFSSFFSHNITSLSYKKFGQTNTLIKKKAI